MMKRLNIWRRLNGSLAVLILLLITASVLAYLVDNARHNYAEFKSRLDKQADRVRLDLLQMNNALRGRLLDPKNEQERLRSRDAENDLRVALYRIETDTPAYFSRSNEPNALAAIGNFVTNKFLPYQTNLLALQKQEDSTTVVAQYAQSYSSSIELEREKVLETFRQQVDAAKEEESRKADKFMITCVIAVIVVLFAAVLAGFHQATALSRPLSGLIEALERMRRGDFTRRLEITRRDEFGVIGEGLNRLADDLSVLVGQVQRSGIQVNTTTTDIAATARQQESTASEIAATTAEIGATSRQITATSKDLVRTMSEVNHMAEQAAQLAGSGQAAINSMESTMRQIMEASGSIASKLAVLDDKTSNINSVVTTITKVADQTNLLSLNAAIEAEKAGEYGLGFAVVAMEIRRLADQTAVATFDIEKMVKEMQSAVTAGVMGMDKFSEELRSGLEEIQQVSDQLARIIEQVQAFTPRFHTVNEGMQSQAAGAHQISETLAQLSDAANQTAESLRHSNHAIEQLNSAARGLQSSVSRFKLEEN
jgi:methyl-accepting chemotaxis protein WspA